MSHKTKIKVVQIIADSEIGGGPTHVLGILKNIDKSKFECYLICPGGYLSRNAKSIEGVTVYNVKMKSKFDFASFVKIKELLHKIQASGFPFAPMVAHFHGARAGFLGRFIMPRNIANVYTEHSMDKNYQLKNPVNTYLQKVINARLNDRTDLIIAVSTSVANFLIENKISPAKRTIVIPNGIDLKRFGDVEKKGKLNVGHPAPVIGVVGTLNRQKGIKYLVDAMPMVLKHFPLATLEIVGDGPEMSKIQNQINGLGLSQNAALLGKKENIGKIIRDFDVFVLPSVSETFGIVILEAMKAGVPVVATEVGGILDIITDGKNGLLTKPRSPKDLAKAIIKILEHPDLASKIKQNGLKRIEDFDWKMVVKKIENVYFHLATKK